MHNFRLITAILIITFLSGCMRKKTVDEHVKAKAQKPNIIFIMSDDHAFQAISADDKSLIETPNIDRLADEGMRFDRCFVTNSISSPSRAVCLTGKHSHLNGLHDNLDVFDSTQQTFPKILQKVGYNTAIIGKWHLKSEPTGFDYWQVLPDQGDYYMPEFRTPEGLIKEEGYVTDIITDKSLIYLDSMNKAGEPFLLMCHHKAPHREWLPAQRHLDSLRSVQYIEPATLFDDYANRGTAAQTAEMHIFDHMGWSNDNKIPPKIAAGKGFNEFMDWYSWAYDKNIKRMNPEEFAKWNATYAPVIDEFMNLNGEDTTIITKWKYQRYMEDYLASIRAVDEGVGRLLDYLDESGLSENTIVVYTSDQGFYLGEHGWFDKRFMYEESFRTPLLVRYPKVIEPNSVNSQLVQNLDFAETFLDVAGAKIPSDMQGLSLLPLFENNDVDWRDALYYHYYEYPGIHAVKRHYGIRTEQYKLIHFYYDVDEWEFYDLDNDPQEMNNLIDNPNYKMTIEALRKRLHELEIQYCDSDSLRQQMITADTSRVLPY